MNKEQELEEFKRTCVTKMENPIVTQERNLKKINKELLTKSLPKKFTKFKKISSFDGDIFREEKLIEIQFEDKTYLGKCFVNKEKREMYWRPMHRWYVFIAELDSAFSYDLVQNKKAKLVATEVEIKKAVDKRIDMLRQKGQYHFKEVIDTYNKLKELEK